MSFSRNSSTYIKEAINVSLLGAKFVPGLEPAALVVQSIVEQADKLKNNRETCDELVERVKISQNILEKYKPPDDVHKEAYRKYIDILKKIEEYIKQLRKPGNFSRRFINKITKFIHAKEDEQLLKHFVDALDHAINAFHLEVGIQVYESISNQAKELSEIKSTTLEIKSTLEIKNIAKGLGARRSDIAKTRLDQKLITDYPLAKDVVGSKRKALVKKMFRSQPVAVRRVVIEYSKVEAADKNKLLNLTVIGKLISDCKNIEKFHGTYLDSDSLYMVTEWVENGNLCDYLKKEPYLPWIDKWRIASEIANAINFCHGVEVLHHNIRAKNVLLDEHLIAKLSNFDTSRFTTGTTTTIPGIRDGLEWKAPEKIRSEVEKRRFDLQHYESEKEKKIIDLKHESLPFNKQMDVYSFGMTLWEIAANGESPFSKIEDEDLEHEIIGGTRPVIPVDTPPAFEKFISEAWNDKWAKRPKIEVIADNLFKNYQLLKEKNSQTKSYLIPPSTPHYQRPLTPVPSDDSLSGTIYYLKVASSNRRYDADCRLAEIYMEVSSTSWTPAGRYGHCSVTYKNQLYVFGGWENNTDENGVNISPNYFFYTTLPITSSNPTWLLLPAGNSTSVGSAACVVTPSGYLLILGGIISSKYTDNKVSTQVYDLNKNIWVDWKSLMQERYPGFGISPKAALITPNYVVVYSGNTGVNEDGKRLPVQFLYFLNMTTMGAWTWSEAKKSSSIDAPISRIIATAKGNIFLFGGYFPYESGDNTGFSTHFYISNRKDQWVSPDANLPFGVRDGAVGIRKNMIYLIASDANNPGVNVFPLDLTSLTFGSTLNFPGMKGRIGASYAQFTGSDSFLIFGGCTVEQCNAPLDTLQVFNMTTKNWTVEHASITKPISSNNFTIPLVNGIDLNAEDDDTDNSIVNPSPSSNPNHGANANADANHSKRTPTWLIVLISCIVTAVFFSFVFAGLWHLRNKMLGPRTSFEITQPPISPPISPTIQTQCNSQNTTSVERSFPSTRMNSSVAAYSSNSASVRNTVDESLHRVSDPPKSEAEIVNVSSNLPEKPSHQSATTTSTPPVPPIPVRSNNRLNTRSEIIGLFDSWDRVAQDTGSNADAGRSGNNSTGNPRPYTYGVPF
ncbi:3834_t:CDS:10 [Ambispora gerdemannii]|uniref:3834_t:CDS:1 n=1 Tax=Ambispora gerdemannii TaxID=144530 RepID=A0A9N8WD68_9GLOM|nr:3834_t:CDS:10 [Ambispora gerdemannii]